LSFCNLLSRLLFVGVCAGDDASVVARRPLRRVLSDAYPLALAGFATSGSDMRLLTICLTEVVIPEPPGKDAEETIDSSLPALKLLAFSLALSAIVLAFAAPCLRAAKNLPAVAPFESRGRHTRHFAGS